MDSFREGRRVMDAFREEQERRERPFLKAIEKKRAEFGPLFEWMAATFLSHTRTQEDHMPDSPRDDSLFDYAEGVSFREVSAFGRGVWGTFNGRRYNHSVRPFTAESAIQEIEKGFRTFELAPDLYPLAQGVLDELKRRQPKPLSAEETLVEALNLAVERCFAVQVATDEAHRKGIVLSTTAADNARTFAETALLWARRDAEEKYPA